MDRHEADLTDVFEQLGSIYELLAEPESRASERHRELLEALGSIDSNTSYSDVSDVVTAIRESNTQLKKIASNTR